MLRALMSLLLVTHQSYPGRQQLALRRGRMSWRGPVCRSSLPCCSVPEEEGRLVQSVTAVQTELHFMPAKELFVSIGNQSNMLFHFLAVTSMHLSV